MGNLPWRALGGSPAVLRKRCQERFHACLHACRHAWTPAGSAPGPAPTSGEALRGSWSGGDGLAGTHHRRASNLKPSSSQRALRES
eukprot:2978766-Pyramimonas_sp.AAC.1